MYDDLIKALRETDFSDGCPCGAEPMCKDRDCVIIQAADAIEFLLTYKVCFENMVQIGGWWLVGQDKALHRMNVPMNWPPKGTKTVEVFPLPEPQKEEC